MKKKMKKMKRNIRAILAGLFAVLMLAAAVPVVSSCEGNKPVDVVVTDYGYTISVDDIHLGTDGNAVCIIRLTKGGAREESVTVNYKIDDDLSLRLKVNGQEIAPGASVSFDVQGQLKLELPALPEGRHTLHLIIKNKYNKEYSKDISFNVIRDKVPATGIAAPASLRLEKGSAIDTVLTLSPADADDKGVGVASSDPTVASASLSGDGAVKKLHVEALSTGTAKLSFSHADLGASAATTAVEVYSYAIAGLKDLTIYETQEQRLQLSVTPEAPISLSASNANISLKDEGSNTWTVRGVKAGDATVTAKSGATAATAKVTVKAPEISGLKNLSMTSGDETTVTLSVEPQMDITLTSSSGCVTVSAAGTNAWKLKAVSEGTAKLTATAGSGTASCTVTVSKKPETIAVTPMSATIAWGQTKTFTVSSSSEFTASLSGEGAKIVELGASSVGVRNDNASFSDAKVSLKLVNKVDQTKTAVADITLEKKKETVTLTETSSAAGTSVWTVGGDNGGWELTGVPSGVKKKVDGNTVTLTNDTYKAVKGRISVKTKVQGVEASADVTVPGLDVTLKSLTATESTSTIYVDDSFSVTVKGTYTDGSEKDLTGSVSWTCSSNLRREGSRFTGLSAGPAEVTASLDGKSATVYISVLSKPVVLKTLRIEPSWFSAVVGESRSFTVTAVMSDGSMNDVSNQCDWSYAGPCKQVMKGYISMTGTGEVVVEATYTKGDVTLTARATGMVTKVSGTVMGVEINPTSATVKVGETVSFQGTVRYSDGSTDASGNFRITDGSVLAGSDGSYVALSEGTCDVVYFLSGYSATAKVTVQKGSGGDGGGTGEVTVTGLSLSRTSLSLLVGRSASISATAKMSDGTVKDVTYLADWTSSNSSVASTDGYGTVSGISAGSASITASYGGRSASCSVTVTAEATLTGLSASPSSISANVGDSPVSLTVKARYSNGTIKDVTSSASYSSTNTSVAKVSGSSVSFVAAGSCTIKITYGGASVEVPVTVIKTEQYTTSIKLNDTYVTLKVGQTYQVDGTVYCENPYNTYPVRAVCSFSSNNPEVAAVNGSGKVTAVKEGTATITAENLGVKASMTVKVVPADVTVSSLRISPTAASVKVGEKYNLYSSVACVAVMSDGSTQTVNPTWSNYYSSNTNYATLDGGIVMAKAKGEARYKATYSGVAASEIFILTITEADKTLSLSPTSLSWGASETGAKTVTVTSNGSWTVSVSTSNFTLSKTSGSGNGSFTVTRGSKNTSSSAITGTVTVSVTGGPSAQVSLSQAGTSSVAVTGVSLDKTSLSLTAGGTGAQLTATVSPSNATNKSVTWSSSIESVATVSSSGYVTPKKEGSTTVIVSTVDGNFKARCNVTVAAGTIAVTGVKVNEGSFELAPGATKQLSATVSPSNATDKTVTWTSDKPSIAKVSSTGLVTGVAEGTTYINAKAGTMSDYVKVTVKNSVVKVTSVTINEADQTINVGGSYQFTVTVKPDNASDKSVSWSSGSTSVATVDASGRVSGVSAGTAKITATAKDGSGKSASRTVTVKKVDYSIVASPASLDWAYSATDKKNVTLTLTNVAAADLQASLSGDSNFSYSISGTTLSVTPKSQNSGTADRTATITVKDSGNKASTSVSLRQAGKPAAVLTSIDVTPTSVSVKEGESATVTATPKDQYGQAFSASLTWKSDNTAVATVSGGKVTGVKAGSTTVYAYSGSVQSARVSVTVNAIPVTGVSLSASSLSLYVGDTKQLTATVSPSNASDKTVTWSSNATSVATVSSDGLVTAKGKGTATITAKAGGKTATCSVTVSEKTVSVTGVSLNKTSLELTEGTSETLTATVSPSNATNKSVTWSSSNTAVATVSGGKVTAVKEGTATITVKTEDGGKTATCSVKIIGKTVAVTGVSLNRTSMTLTEGDTESLVATITPSNATNQNVTWSSSNTAVATVSGGTVKAVKYGTATITVKTEDGGKTATCAVEVKAKSEKKEIRFSRNPSVSLVEGDSKALDYEIKYYVNDKETSFPSSSTYTLSFVSDNTSAVTVSEVGGKWTATGVKAGSAKVKAKMFIKSTGETLVTAGYISVSVSAATPTNIAIYSVNLVDGTDLALNIGKAETLTVKVFNQNGGEMTGATITVTSDNTSVASIKKGLGSNEWTLTAAGQGTCKVTAKSGSLSKTINVTVTDKPKAITVSPANRTIIAANAETLTLSATAEYNDGSSRNVTDKCTWNVQAGSAGQGVAGATNVINAADFSAGTTLKVTATYNGVSGTTNVYVK